MKSIPSIRDAGLPASRTGKANLKKIQNIGIERTTSSHQLMLTWWRRTIVPSTTTNSMTATWCRRARNNGLECPVVERDIPRDERGPNC